MWNNNTAKHAVEHAEDDVAARSAFYSEKIVKRAKIEGNNDGVSGDAIAATVLQCFAKLPKKRKPLEGGGKKEWLPLAGIVAEVDGRLECIALGTGMKCLPSNKLSSAEGKVLHDWHAEVVALRSLNYFFVQEINKIRGAGTFLNSPSESSYIRPLSPKERQDSRRRDAPDYQYTIRSNIKLHMYCSEAPCGDASMELTMAAQEDATPWKTPSTLAEGETPLPGRGGFGQLGIVRRKPSRPDAPECRSKSCSDKLAQKQLTSVLNTLSSILISPENAYLESFTMPESQFVPEAWERCFGENGRLQGLSSENNIVGGYGWHAMRPLATTVDFAYSRRSLAADRTSPKPSNIACSWSPHHSETIIGGILQGCKLSSPVRDEAASLLSRYKMWQAMEADMPDSMPFRDYAHVKKKRSEARASAKAMVRTTMMRGEAWPANGGDDDFGRESAQAVVKRTKPLEYITDGVDCDAADKPSANLASTKKGI